MTVEGIEGRVALVTGAAGDFGRRTAVRLATSGALVLAADQPSARARLEPTVEACQAASTDASADALLFDVTDAEAARSAIGAAEHRFGPIQLLVNNAGYQGAFASVLDYPLDDLRAVLDVNVVGSFAVLQAAGAQMVAAGGGAIVNIASMAGVSGAVNMPAYAASKAAVSGLTRAAAKDLASHGIRVNAVSPGFIGPGAMWDRQVAEQAALPSASYADDPETVRRQMIGSIPLGRYGTVDEVVSAVLFLLSDGAGFVTGVDLEISGGGR